MKPASVIIPRMKRVVSGSLKTNERSTEVDDDNDRLIVTWLTQISHPTRSTCSRCSLFPSCTYAIGVGTAVGAHRIMAQNSCEHRYCLFFPEVACTPHTRLQNAIFHTQNAETPENFKQTKRRTENWKIMRENAAYGLNCILDVSIMITTST